MQNLILPTQGSELPYDLMASYTGGRLNAFIGALISAAIPMVASIAIGLAGAKMKHTQVKTSANIVTKNNKLISEANEFFVENAQIDQFSVPKLSMFTSKSKFTSISKDTLDANTIAKGQVDAQVKTQITVLTKEKNNMAKINEDILADNEALFNGDVNAIISEIEAFEKHHTKLNKIINGDDNLARAVYIKFMELDKETFAAMPDGPEKNALKNKMARRKTLSDADIIREIREVASVAFEIATNDLKTLNNFLKINTKLTKLTSIKTEFAKNTKELAVLNFGNAHAIGAANTLMLAGTVGALASGTVFALTAIFGSPNNSSNSYADTFGFASNPFKSATAKQAAVYLR